jgi:hypothetical protein
MAKSAKILRNAVLQILKSCKNLIIALGYPPRAFFIKLQSMRVFLLVLLLILNVFAEAKGSGTAQGGKSTKKAKTTVVAKAKKPAQKSKRKIEDRSSSSVASSSSEDDPLESTALNETDSLAAPVADTTNDVVVVRDTIVDTVYVVFPDTAKKQKEEVNIPLPHQSAYLREGISVGIGAGLFNATDDCDCLGIWQGKVEYHYNEFITGGLDVRFFGGTLDHDVMLLYQRYRLNARFHKSFYGADFYASALLGLETTDLSEFRKELREGIRKNRTDYGDSSGTVVVDETSSDGSVDEIVQDSLDSEKNCEKMFALDGFTFGLEVGMGVLLSRYIGFVGSATYEFNLSWTQLVAISPGVAFNLREVWPWAKRNLRSTWISLEVVFQRYFNRDVKEWAVAGFVGVQLGI